VGNVPSNNAVENDAPRASLARAFHLERSVAARSAFFRIGF